MGIATGPDGLRQASRGHQEVCGGWRDPQGGVEEEDCCLISARSVYITSHVMWKVECKKTGLLFGCRTILALSISQAQYLRAQHGARPMSTAEGKGVGIASQTYRRRALERGTDLLNLNTSYGLPLACDLTHSFSVFRPDRASALRTTADHLAGGSRVYKTRS